MKYWQEEPSRTTRARKESNVFTPASNVRALTLAIAVALSACESGGQRHLDAGTGGTAGRDSGTGGAGTGGAGGGGGAPSACTIDTSAADWFAGVWTGVQAGEAFTVTNSGGCSIWTGTVDGVLCDYCWGTYTLTGAGTGTSSLSCEPKSSCSVSPVHTDTGNITFTGCTFLYDYAYAGASGAGRSTFTGPIRIGDAPTTVCQTAGLLP